MTRGRGEAARHACPNPRRSRARSVKITRRVTNQLKNFLWLPLQRERRLPRIDPAELLGGGASVGRSRKMSEQQVINGRWLHATSPAARSFTLSFTPHVGNRFSCLAPRPQFTHLRVRGSKTRPPKHKVTSWSDAVGEGGERGGAQVHCK